MNRDQTAYLESLVRMDIRKRQRGLGKFAAKPGQGAAEAQAVREKMARDLAWKQLVLEALRGEKRPGVEAIAQARQYIHRGTVPADPADGDLITRAMWHLAAEGIPHRLERLAYAGALIAMEIEQETEHPAGVPVITVRAGDEA